MSAAAKLKPPALQDTLVRLRACTEAREWAGDRDLATAWAECPNGSWMLWLAARACVDHHLVVEAACRCAEAVIGAVPEGEERPIRAIRAARAWIRGETSLEEVRRAADAAAAAYAAACADAAACAAAAAFAAAAAAVVGVADVADAAAYAARSFARASARADCADLVRQVISAEDVAKALEGNS